MVTCHYTSLDREALLYLQGPDAATFAQGQFTCDTRKLTALNALPGTYCTVQGRVVCDFVLCRLGDDHLALRMRRDIRAASAAVLGKYIVFSKAKLEAEREDWQIFACWGSGARATLETVFASAPQSAYGVCRGEGFALVQLDEAGQQFELYLLAGAAANWQDKLRAAAQPGNSADWEALQIAAGIARIEAATSGEFVPQMLNYDVTGHISFNKGCYTGQEVVARLHYRGKAKRRMYTARVACAAGEAPAPGAALYSADSTQAVGNLVNGVLVDGTLQALVTATEAGVSSGLHLGVPDGPLLVTAAPPYPMPEK